MRSRALVVGNPEAGSGRGRATLEALAPELEGWPLPVRLEWTREKGHAEELAASAADADFGLVVAAGGDGTVNEVVTGLLRASPGERPELGVLPLGTANDFVASLGMVADPEKVVRMLPDAPVREIDVGRARTAGGGADGDAFVNAAHVGLGAIVARRVAESRWLRFLGPATYSVAALLCLTRYRGAPIEMSVDGEAVWSGTCLNLSVCNGPYFGGGIRPHPRAALDSGRLHAVTVGRISRLRALREMGRLILGESLEETVAKTFVARELEVDGDGDVELDGELRGRLPACFEILPRALRVRVPARGAD